MDPRLNGGLLVSFYLLIFEDGVSLCCLMGSLCLPALASLVAGTTDNVVPDVFTGSLLLQASIANCWVWGMS